MPEFQDDTVKERNYNSHRHINPEKKKLLFERYRLLRVRYVYQAYPGQEVFGKWYPVTEMLMADLPLRPHKDYTPIRVEFAEVQTPRASAPVVLREGQK